VAAEETPANSPTVELQPNNQPRVVSFVKQWPSDQAPGGVLAVSNLLARVHVEYTVKKSLRYFIVYEVI